MGKPQPKKADERYVEYLRTELNLRYMDQKYRNAYKWLPRLAIEGPHDKPDETLKKLRNRITQLRAERRRYIAARLREKRNQAGPRRGLKQSIPITAIPARRRYFWPLPGAMELAAQLAAVRYFSVEQYPPIHHKWAGSLDGIVRASGFRDYTWASPENDDTEASHQFLSHGAGTDPYDFTGATGLQFLGEIEVQPNLIVDDIDLYGFGGILQYTLPEAPWDGAAEWRVDQRFVLPRVTALADWGYFSLVSCAWQSPSGEDFLDDFPESFGLESNQSVAQADGEGFSAGPFDVTDSFLSSFPVSKGQKARIYVGLSILLMAKDGTVTLGDPNMAYHSTAGGAGLSYSFSTSV